MIEIQETVVIDGREFVFHASQVEEPKYCSWTLKSIVGEIEHVDFDNSKLSVSVRKYGIENDIVGSLDAVEAYPRDSYPSILLDNVAANTSHIPEELGYKSVRGIGTYLLNSLAQHADRNNLRIYVHPVPRGRSRTAEWLTSWYRQFGFIASEGIAQYGHYPMHRNPSNS